MVERSSITKNESAILQSSKMKTFHECNEVDTYVQMMSATHTGSVTRANQVEVNLALVMLSSCFYSDKE